MTEIAATIDSADAVKIEAKTKAKKKRPRSPKRRPKLRPRLGSIKAAEDYSGMGHSFLYEKAAQHEGLFVKWGGATRVNFDVLDQIIDALPAARIKPAFHATN